MRTGNMSRMRVSQLVSMEDLYRANALRSLADRRGRRALERTTEGTEEEEDWGTGLNEYGLADCMMACSLASCLCDSCTMSMLVVSAWAMASDWAGPGPVHDRTLEKAKARRRGRDTK